LSDYQELVMVRSKRRAAKLAPLETLFESSRDHALPLPGRLARLYGTFRMSTPRSGCGAVNLRLPVFASGRVPAMIVTTTAGAKQLLKQQIPDSVRVHVIRGRAEIPAAAILEAVSRVGGGKRVLVEGGPRLLGSFYNERLIDEQFLSLAPQLSGREFGDARMSLVMGKLFAPRNPLWGKLIDVRRGSTLLFLRYRFRQAAESRKALYHWGAVV
jgi:hypothetical protein